MSFQQINIDQGWKFKQATKLNNGTASDKFYPVAQFPTVAQLDLMSHGLLKDQLVGLNEVEGLWVGEADWTYKTEEFPVVSLSKSQTAQLVFEGLDTAADVYLNGEKILSVKDMHIRYEVDVTEILKRVTTKTTLLEIQFESGVMKARKERKVLGYNGGGQGLNFGGTERLFLRKAQYHWGWDWGPVIHTCGPYRPIYLQVYETKVSDVVSNVELSPDFSSASVKVSGNVLGEQDTSVEVTIFDPQGSVVEKQKVGVSKGRFTASLTVDKPSLWYPFMYGEQPLYSFTVKAGDAHEVKKAFGIRKVRLVQEPVKDGEGTSFTFEINGIQVFCGGSNWIPGDLIIPRIKKEDYEKWIHLAKVGNHTMVRIWGGGVVEPDWFFDACDKEGILVWVDFQFACGNYPSHGDYLRDVNEEVRQQVTDKANHPSIVLWCGNNEDYLLADKWEWTYDKNDKKGPWNDTNFPARWIYEIEMPRIVSEITPEIPYWESSPYGGATANDPTVGDTHIWDIWSGPLYPYQDYARLASRFVSEFGFEAPAEIRTICKGIPDVTQQNASSFMFDARDKGTGNARRPALYMAENFRFRMDPLEDYIYCTQILQAEAMSWALMSFRRLFRGPGNQLCSGGLVWQLNDVWACASWALVDVDYNPKLAFYSSKHALEPVVVGSVRETTEATSYILRSIVPEKNICSIWAGTVSLKDQEYLLKIEAFDIESGKAIDAGAVEFHSDVKVSKTGAAWSIVLGPNKSTELAKVSLTSPKTAVIVSTLLDAHSGAKVAENVSWPEPYKYTKFAKAPKVNITSVSSNKVSITTDVPLKAVQLYVDPKEGEDALWNDNYLDLVPGESYTVGVEGLKGRKVSVRWMCDWESETKAISA